VHHTKISNVANQPKLQAYTTSYINLVNKIIKRFPGASGHSNVDD